MKKGLKIGLVFGTLLMLMALMFVNNVSACSDTPLDTELVYGRKKIAVGNVNVDWQWLGTGIYIPLLKITYTTFGDWEMTETHLAVAEKYDDPEIPPWAGIPTNKKGNPTIGHFPYYGKTGTHLVYLIPFSEIPNNEGETGVTFGDTVVICAHAVVTDGSQEETAWGDSYGQPFSGSSTALWVEWTIS